MSIITVQTGINMYPWKIPQRAQQTIMNEYLRINKKSADTIFSAGIFNEHYSRLFMILDERENIQNIVFTTIFQIPKSKSGIDVFKTLTKNYTIYFALENVIVKNLDELNIIIKELSISRNKPIIQNYNIDELYKMNKF